MSIALLAAGSVCAQPVRPAPDAGATALALHRLTVVGSVLYLAAHPDDENTRLIAWLANERLVRTGYLSLTRGDGGQNLIGPEIREKLGLIRTQELLAARRVDGGEQFFTRANDFGFSKSPEEALRIWDREQVLADVVRTIRRFRPDVIVTRFSPKPMNTHGHHTASAQLAEEAFEAAADPARFPEQIAREGLKPWRTTRLLWNTSAFFFDNNPNFDKSGLLTVDCGGYNPLLGRSYGEIAALSRSQHRSQGFGSAGARGQILEYFQALKGPAAKADLLEGLDLTWHRVLGADKAGKLLTRAWEQFDVRDPAATVPALLAARRALLEVPDDGYWRARKLAELDEVLRRCAGLYLEATAADWALTSGQPVRVAVEVVARERRVPVTVEAVGVPELSADTTVGHALAFNQPLMVALRRLVPATLPAGQPYWLREEPAVGMYRVTDAALIGAPENPPVLTARVRVRVGGTPAGTGSELLTFTLPVQYRRADPAVGEVYRPLAVLPSVALSLPDGGVRVFTDDQPRSVAVTVRATQRTAKGVVRLMLPAGWRAEPATQPFTLPVAESEQTISFQVSPPPGQLAAEGTLRAVAEVADDGTTAVIDQGLITLHYPHIPDQVLLPPATAHLVRADVRRQGQQIGYVMGAGDDVPAALRQLGYTVTLLAENDLVPATLRRFDAVVLGVRAYNTLDWLRVRQPALLEYTQAGGTVVVQYNTDQRLVLPTPGPYPLTVSRDRVTDEAAPVELLAPQDPLLTTPNKITAADFRGWVQEQGLYYPSKWDSHYIPLLSSHDPGEPALSGALLVARHGKGAWVYTGLSFFRQLPAGVPGALRLFANLLAGGS